MVQKKTIFKRPTSDNDRWVNRTDVNSQSSLSNYYRSIRDEARRIVEDVSMEATKESIRREHAQKEKFDELVNRSQKQLFRISSVFPLDFFPDELVIEHTQVNLHIRHFFWTQEIMTIPIKNIIDCKLSASPFFASLSFVDVGFGDYNHQTINNLWKKEAEKARDIIQGLIAATKEDIDLTSIPENELRRKSERLGNSHAN